MAITKTIYQVTWSGSNSSSVSAASNATSDEQAIADNSISGLLAIKADNNGTPASGDVITAWILFNMGDIDVGTETTDEFTTKLHEAPIALDTNSEDPAIVRVTIPTAAQGFKVYVENDASSNGITVSAQYLEQTA